MTDLSADLLVARSPSPPALPGEPDRLVLVSGLASDAHTWNLVFLQLLIGELGYAVVNLGPCVPDDLLVAECLELRPVLVVISSVNGHGYQDGLRLIRRLRDTEQLAGLPVVIGGKLTTSGSRNDRLAGDLLAVGYDAVFDDSTEAVAAFQRFVGSVRQRALT